MNTTTDCEILEQHLGSYVDGTLAPNELQQVEAHLRGCAACRDSLKEFTAVKGLMELVQSESRAVSAPAEAQAEPAPLGIIERLGAAPWWFVSAAMHVLIVGLAGLLSMAIEMPRSDDSVIMVTELQHAPEAQQQPDAPKPEPQDALMSRHETPATDPTSNEASNIVVPPDILAKASLSDHFETINPDLPDTHSAFGNPDAQSFHSVQGNNDAAGGGGTGGLGMEDMIGVGGAGSRGSGGGFGGGDGTGVGAGSGAGKGSFGQRSGGGRRLLVKKNGGTKASEGAVEKALHWLAYHQDADGHWDAQKLGTQHCPFPGQPANGVAGKPDTAVTGLALLAFLGAGHTERVGQYKDNVQRAVAWLISVQHPNGLERNATDTGENGVGYSAAIATMALAEAAGMANIKATKEAAQKAVDYCTEVHQNGEGSEKRAWRYGAKFANEDISVSGWFIMALKSAKVAGLHVNPASFEGAAKFLDKCEKKDPVGAEGIDASYGPPREYGYGDDGVPNASVNSTRTAIGLLCRQFMGVKKEELQSSVELLMKKGRAPDVTNSNWPGLYYQYYGTLCAFQQGGDLWTKWNDGLQATLVPSQCKDGDDAGSWTPNGSWAWGWGRVGQTALSTLCLEVYYRYERLHQ